MQSDSTPSGDGLAMKVLSQPASASGAEQSWSEYDYIHSKRRNRLKPDTASKLVYVHSNLRLLRNCRQCTRYTKLLALGDEQARIHEEQLLLRLENEGWDGNCSDVDEEDLAAEDSISSAISQAPNPEYLDTSSFIGRGTTELEGREEAFNQTHN